MTYKSKNTYENPLYDEDAVNKRMNVIGQNGNEGTHYNVRYTVKETGRDEYTIFKDGEIYYCPIINQPKKFAVESSAVEWADKHNT